MIPITRFLAAATLLATIATSCFGKQQDNDFSIASIPANIRKDADAVVRYSHTTIDVVSPTEIHVVRNVAVTIFNAAAAEMGAIVGIHDPMQKVKSMSGAIYDKDGDRVQKVSNKDVYTAGSETHAFSSDEYYKICRYDYKSYPYTCEYEIVSVISSLFYLPDWDPQPIHNCAVIDADITVQYPLDCRLNCKSYNLPVPFRSDSTGDMHTLSASIHNIPAFPEPDYFTPATPASPTINITARHLSMDDHEGSMTSWQSFGKFVYDVNKDRDALPNNIRKEVHALTDTCKSTTSKIDLLYHLLQHSTRYVLMVFGIGGIQTYDAQYVAEKKYGDCKALSNYMKALLKEAGIPAYTAIVYGGSNPPVPDFSFPSNIFNHMILCVPDIKDTTWLECTSPTDPTGYMSSFTANRYALLLTPSGGTLVRTPALNEKTNLINRHIDIELNEALEMKATTRMSYSGSFWDKEYPKVIDVPATDAEKYLNSKLKIGTYSVGKFSIEQQRHNGIPSITEHAILTGQGNISVSGQRLVANHAVFSLPLIEPTSYDNRTVPFEVKNGFTASDTVIVHIPAGYTMPAKKETVLEFPFGTYHYKVQLSVNALTFYTSIVMRNGTYDAAQYASYLKMYRQAKTDLATSTILEKKG